MRHRRIPTRRERATGSRLPLLRCDVKRTRSAPPTTSIDSLEVEMSSVLRPQASVFLLMPVRLLSCSAVPSASSRAGTGSKRGGVFMHRTLLVARPLINIQNWETEI